jgi:hypothetical protein
MKLEKFDLEKALNGAKVVTRHGREVKELIKFESLKDYPLGGVLDNQLKTWTEQGKFDTEHVGESNLDLCLAVEPQSIWVNVLKINGQIGLGAIGYTKEEAINNNYHTDKYIKTIEITDEL